MTAKRRSGGRPRLTEGKRTKKIDVRFTEDEFKIILELEANLGMNRTDLIRLRILSDAQNIVINARELIGLVDSIGTEMAHCANNINQLAKHANILKKMGKTDPAVTERFSSLLTAYLQCQQSLEIAFRQIIRLAGR
ncbi:plasmid mobilization protein [Mucilaginibacter sp. X5P1]|uniref:plasmid mobilization protein n=1 Tax=Mucilaginibacter sp. X5P1 TaxID=2723088 RepID=UPI001622C9D8|nr:plasmid mobilization relaxosome protein MobC [Mucilaginibacter sp. X5P1]MBB6137676.1 uncharacterized protein (DUF1778 family) [Mucilaginibacter sp. X5P1]